MSAKDAAMSAKDAAMCAKDGIKDATMCAKGGPCRIRCGGTRRYGSVRGFISSRDGVGSPVGVLLASNFERTPSAALRDLLIS